MTLSADLTNRDCGLDLAVRLFMVGVAAYQKKDGGPGLSSARVLTMDRATDLVHRVIYDPVLKNKIHTVLRRLGGIKSDELWDAYFTAYDQIVSYDDGYRELIETAHKHLPRRGQINDYGAGTGNFSIGLLNRSSLRTVALFDFSQIALSVAETKLKSLSLPVDQTARFKLQREDFKANVSRPLDLNEYADAALVNGLFYTLPWSNKINLLRRIFNDLKPGAVLLINEPKESLQKSQNALMQFLTTIAECAVANGSPVTELQLALFVSINHQVLTATSLHFTPLEKLQRLAESIGFQFEKAFVDGYYGQTATLILKKPQTHQLSITLQRSRQVDVFLGQQQQENLSVIRRSLSEVDRTFRERSPQHIVDFIQKENVLLDQLRDQSTHFVITDANATVSAYQMLIGARTESATLARLPLELEFPHLNLSVFSPIKCEIKRVFCAPESSCKELLTALAIFLSKRFAANMKDVKVYAHVTNERVLNHYIEELGYELALSPADLRRDGHWVVAITGDALLNLYFPITRRHWTSGKLMQTVAQSRPPLELRPRVPAAADSDL